MGRRRAWPAAAACACALACAARSARAQLSQLAARVDNCHGSASGASCVPSLQLTFDVSWPAPTWAAVAVLPRDQGIVDGSGASWAPTADIVLTVSSAQPGRSDYALAFDRTCYNAYEEDSGVGVAAPADAAASCVLPGGGARSLRRDTAALSTFLVAHRGEIYGVSVAATQGAVAATATAEASAAPLQAAPGMLLQLSASAAASSQPSVSSFVLVAANATDEGVLMPRALVGDGANALCVSPQSWSQCKPCAASLGACTAVPAGGPTRDQLQSFRGTTLASVLSSSRGVTCSYVAAASASPAPGGGAASQAVFCAGDGASRAQVTLSLARFSLAQQPAAPPSPPGAQAAAPAAPSSNASALAPAAAACGEGGPCSRASGANCTCGAHGTLATSASGACSCVCDSGWATNPDQDLFAPVYCGMQATTVAAMGNPEVAAGAVPATAFAAGGGLTGTSLTPSGWALIVGVSVALVCICCCCFRYGRRRGCGRRDGRAEAAGSAKHPAAREAEGGHASPPPRQNSLRAMSDGLRRLLAFRMRQNMLAAVGSHVSYDGTGDGAACAPLSGGTRARQPLRSVHPHPHRSKGRRSHRRSRRESSSDEDSGTELTSYDDSDEESARRRRRSGSRHASRRERRHGPLKAPHPLTPPVLYGSRSAAMAGPPAPYSMLLSPPGSPLQPPGHDWHAAAAMQALAAPAGRMPRPSAPPDPGYSLALADHAYITHVNGLFAPSGAALADGGEDLAAVMAAARLVDAYMQRHAAGSGSPPRAPPAAAVWPAFSPPQPPSRARTPHHKLAPGSSPGRTPAPLPTREQALRSLARELDAASVESSMPVAAGRRLTGTAVGGSDAEDDAAGGTSEVEDAFEDFIDGDAEWLAACRAEAAQRQRSPSAAQVQAGHHSRSESAGAGSRAGRHRRTLTLG